uniref:Uncharacterized protein n=1 Tax=Tanacetum cinerariifolium TaxID=118510 RepID=A0A699IWF4_TANCI|nr:hypothetical protein [Tanacetum cinerariifolium]
MHPSGEIFSLEMKEDLIVYPMRLSLNSLHLWDKAINEEIDDRLVRVGTTASSLEAEQDKLEKKQRLRNHKLKRLYKVGFSARVESSDDEGLGEEDASKQERIIDDLDADEDITLVNNQRIFDSNKD